MQAQVKRHIRSGQLYSPLIPHCNHKDTVIVGSGKARLEDTLKLMQSLVVETQADTALLAKKLKGGTLTTTCKNIWQFVYGHIQYKMDKTGIEQVRRPSRTWADRKTGVDCDCYTVFISSLLSNLGIAHHMRLTKYGGKGNFQHVYPIVPIGDKHITIDCVTDRFNYEVPFSEKRDVALHTRLRRRSTEGLSGVDTNAILDALQQPKQPLWSVKHKHDYQRPCYLPVVTVPTPVIAPRLATMVSPLRFEEERYSGPLESDNGFNLWDVLMLSSISIVAGIGVLKLIGNPNRKSKQKKTNRTKRTLKKRA